MTLLVLCMAGLLGAVLLLLLWGQRTREALAVAAFVCVGSVALYALFGSPLLLEHMRDLEEKIEENSLRVQKDPADLESWLIMAQAEFDSGNYKAAAEGFRRAVLVSKGQPRIITAYAEALIFDADGKVTMAAQKSIHIALMLDPQLPLARYYNAVWLLQNGKQEQAMAEMKKLYAELPDDSKLKKRMNAEIGRE